MERMIPNYYPSFANNYLQVYNHLNQDGSYLWYDSENPDNVAYPSNFTLKKTSNWNSTLNLRLNRVTFNPSSTLNSSSTLPTAVGGFNATLRREGTSAPTVNLYFTGNIAKGNITVAADYDYDVPTPAVASMGTPSFSFNSGRGIFPNSYSTEVLWVRSSGNPTFFPSTFSSNGSTYYYRYVGDRISFTTNWNNERKQSNETAPSTPLKFTSPNVETITSIPTVYCTWEVLWDYPCSCNTDCGCYSACGCNSDSSYVQWSGTYTGGYIIRTGPGTNYGQATSPILNNSVTVIGESGDWYQFLYVSTSGNAIGWVYYDGISGNNPNHSGCSSDYCSCDGEDYCYDDYCWEDTCTYHVPGCYCDDDYVCTSHSCPRNF